MKSLSLSLVLFCSVLITSAQQFTLETGLDATVNETSGLLFVNNTLITHNDTENTNQLFEIDPSTGAVTRTVTITNATNEDWEDLAYDGTYIYIGDFGNFRGDRIDLKIYRISLADYFASTSVTADVIEFNYSNQTDFTPSPLATNFDAEGLIHYNNSLYIFSKNWLNGNTDIYELPKAIGSHSISIVDSISVQGLVSGATYNSLEDSIVLTGYDANGSFLIQLSGFNSGLFSNGIVTKTSINAPTNYSPQIEGITPINTNEYFISAEENSTLSSGLYSFNTSTLSVLETNDIAILFYPNPAKNAITLNGENLFTKFYSITGQLVKVSSDKHIDISDLSTGIYMVKIEDSSSLNSVTKRLIISH